MLAAVGPDCMWAYIYRVRVSAQTQPRFPSLSATHTFSSPLLNTMRFAIVIVAASLLATTSASVIRFPYLQPRAFASGEPEPHADDLAVRDFASGEPEPHAGDLATRDFASGEPEPHSGDLAVRDFASGEPEPHVHDLISRDFASGEPEPHANDLA
ncbi:hypothetical protein MIND_01112500 [Mycena indigotica]|uniref:Transmembrane protein n=1 Tax=Mycena indigotica TaxID=2126181 RepID=A0A8H6SD72_9AGAR|nr:uncharacterized protein MIND_01112500 [Mycena indigotica]KAF7295720.1 hypothetical protein MIND_01112500 [Mycena indigotica]